MQELVREYLNDLGKKHRKRRRFRVVSVVFALIVVSGVIWGLSRAGIATTGEPRCGREEHQHTDACYSDVLNCGMEEDGGHQHTDTCYQTAELALICGMDESEEHQHTDECYQTAEPVLICGQEEYEGHTHADACYTKQLACGKEEHQHEDDCYIDKSADVEDASKWNAQYENIEWENEWGKDLVTAAKLQLDYKESAANYMVAEDGSHKGYTRYGQFDGDPYTDWDASFVNFCMYYAGLKSSQMFPDEKNTAEWYDKFIKDDEGKKKVYLAIPGDYEPQEGDLIFLKKENEETEFQMGIVSSYNKEDKEKNEFKVIEGNSDNRVKENTYKIDDEHIFEYIKIAEMEKAYKESQQPAAEPEQPAEDTQAPEEATIELSTEVDGVTITLYGPESSFEAGKEYTIQAEKVEDEEVLATVEEAVEQMAEEKEKKVENFQPYDIKLMLDGEEVQPLGPVAVKFSGKEVVESVENEETEVNVLHVDENTGEATDMEATPTEEKEVVIETEHFSVYVYVELGDQAIGGIKINIQHWGEKIQTVAGDHKTMNANTPEYGFDVPTGKVRMTGEKDDGTYDEEQRKYQLYVSDTDYSLPNETYIDIKSLNKVYNVSDTGYKISKVWVSEGGEADRAKYDETTQDWPAGEYTEYTYEQLEQSERIELDRLPDGCTIRFWYEPVKGTKREEVSFYDYTVGFKLDADQEKFTENGDRAGINKDANFTEGATDTSPRLGVGQKPFGNGSSWVSDVYKGKNLNAGNRVNNCDYAFTGLVKSTLINGTLAFVDDIDVPNNLFTDDPENGSRLFEDYQLGFLREGDTYTLSEVYRGDSQTPVQSAKDLTEFSKINKWVPSTQPEGSNGYVFSNKFWPLDGAENQVDPQGKGDFGEIHNWYFGMAYEIDFDITDYKGPLQYYFRGDDDFWLFVDGQLAVDLGGIHSALGTSFDLKDFMEKHNLLTDGEHTLSVYYMERGATGSTCYMQFTLPRVQINPLPQQPTTSCTVKKEWDDDDNRFRPQTIRVTLYKEKEGEDKVPVRTITLPTDDGKWEYTWDNLPVYDGKSGKKISYTAEEVLEANNPMWDYEVEVENQEGTDEILAIITNKLKLHKIKVEKLWQGDDNEKLNRPDEIEFQLLYRDYVNNSGELVPYLDRNGEPRTVKLTEDSNGKWEGEFTKIPRYYYNASERVWKEVDYWIQEISNSVIVGEYNGKNGAIYKVGNVVEIELTDIEKEQLYIGSFSITNTLATKNVCIEKISKSTNTPGLSGAVFNLYTEDAFDENGELKETADAFRPSIITGDKGLVDIQGLRFGTYYLVEIQAPIHYALLEKPIKIISSKDGVSVDFQIDGWDNGSDHVKFVEEEGKYIVTIPNEIMYELPSTGGSGIYWYMFSGVLLMAAASLITYRNKRREVLRS